jgi:cytochrome P450
MALQLATADRDSVRVAAPDVLDPARTEKLRVGSGRGRHYCLGALPARMGLEVSGDARGGVS